MGWYLATSDIPERPFAVIDGKGSVAGCHPSRQLAMLQATALNSYGADPEADADAVAAEVKRATPKVETVEAEEKPKRQPTPVAFSRSQTQAW